MVTSTSYLDQRSYDLLSTHILQNDQHRTLLCIMRSFDYLNVELSIDSFRNLFKLGCSQTQILSDNWPAKRYVSDYISLADAFCGYGFLALFTVII